MKKRVRLRWHHELKDFCWLYLAVTGNSGRVDGEGGYTQICIRRADRYKYGNKRFPNVHRVAYIEWVGPIPPGYTIDHKCSRRNCINPNHLEAVTLAENLSRSSYAPSTKNKNKTHCTKGHPLSGENLYLHNGLRHCRACRANRVIQYDNRNRELRAHKARELRARRKNEQS